MIQCQVCLKRCRSLKFDTGRIKVCANCVMFLNTSTMSPFDAELEIGQLFRKGIEKRMLSDLGYVDKARLENDYQRAFPRWCNRVLSDNKNSKDIFKVVRAYRRGLINHKRLFRKYPSTWESSASEIRKLDRFSCLLCGETGVLLDVHHIVYLSNNGSNTRNNLVSLCRSCHEEEHGRKFDAVPTEVGQDHAPVLVVEKECEFAPVVQEIKPLRLDVAPELLSDGFSIRAGVTPEDPFESVQSDGTLEPRRTGEVERSSDVCVVYVLLVVLGVLLAVFF